MLKLPVASFVTELLLCIVRAQRRIEDKEEGHETGLHGFFLIFTYVFMTV